MTRNQLQYQQNLITQQDNIRRAQETERSNLAKEQETQRANLEKERETRENNQRINLRKIEENAIKGADVAAKTVTSVLKFIPF